MGECGPREPAYDGHAKEDVEGAEDELHVDQATHARLTLVLHGPVTLGQVRLGQVRTG